MLKFDRLPALYATLLAGSLVGLSVGFLATADLAPATADARWPVSNASAKADRLDLSSRHAAVPQRIAPTAVVSHVEVAGPKGATVTLVDAEGRTVYRSDPLRNETLVVRDAKIPSVTVRDTADATAEIKIVSVGEGKAPKAAPATASGPTLTASR